MEENPKAFGCILSCGKQTWLTCAVAASIKINPSKDPNKSESYHKV